MSVKFGISQTDSPAPKSYRAFSNAMIIFILPAAGVLISSLDFPDRVAKHILTILTFAPSLIKGIGVFLGNGQYYTSDPAKADNPPKDETK